MVFGKKKEDGKEDGAEGGDGEEEKEEPTKEKEKGATVEMRQGDYMIHMYLEKIKEINVKEGETMDPMIQLECLGQKTFSSAKDDVGGIGEIIWDEHLFLEPKQVSPKDAEDAKIEIRLMDKGMFKDALIGQFDLDLTFVYLKPEHVLLHKWIALNNPNGDDYATIQAYVKVSVAVACTGDEQVQITEDEGPEDTQVMMSPSLNPSFYQIKIRVFQGWDLPSLDSAIGFIGSDKIDAYMKLEFKAKKYKTKVETQPKGGPPVHWNTEFWLPAQLPVLAPKIELKLMDHDDIGSDELAGTLQLKTKEIIEDKYGNNGQFVWHNIYGCPLNQSGSKAKEIMNNDPDFASEWKGRVLLQIIGEATEKPMAKQQAIDPDIVDRAQEAAKLKKYSIIAQVGQAVALPTHKKYNIQITVGGKRLLFEPFAQKNASNYKRYDRIDQQDFEMPYVDCHDFDKVIVHLMDGDTPVCFFKDDIENYLDPNPAMQWHSFLPDLSVKKVKKPDQVGQFSFRLSLHDVSANEPIEFKKFDAWKKKVPKRSNPVKIRAYIYQCRDLPAADSNGTSDPFVKVWDVGTAVKKSAVVEDNNNPLFYECIELDYEVVDQEDLESYPPFIFDIYDHDDDLFDSTPDFLCRAIVEPEDCSIIMQKDFEHCKEHQQKDCNMCAHLLAEIPDTPRWHPCYFSPGTPRCGEILVSFAVADHDFVFPQVYKNVDLRAKVNFRDFEVNMLVLGLRDLASPGILPVKKAFINFNIKSLVPPNGPAVKNIQTEPTAPGPNPTLNTTMKFGIPLPTDPLYCPRLACTVYDCIFKGWSQPQIGTFDIPIGQLMQDLEAERTEETQIIVDISAELEKMILAAPEDLVPTYSIQNTSPDEQENVGTEIGRADSEYSVTGPQESESQRDADKTKLQTKKKKKKAVAALKNQDSIVDQSEVLGPNEHDGNVNAIAAQQDQLAQVKAKRQEIMAAVSEGSKHAPSPMSRQASGLGSPRLSNAGSAQASALSSKNELKEAMKQASELEKRLESDEKTRVKEDMIAKGQDAHQMIIMPKYKLDQRLQVDREVDPPSKTLYIGLGWDEHSGQGRKHYRQFYNDELENDKEIFPRESPFESYELHKGQSRGGASNGLFSSATPDATGNASTIKVVGKFKAIVEVANRDDTEAYRKHKAEIIEKLKFQLNTISLKLYKKPFLFDADKLASAVERQKFEVELRKLKVEHLQISKHLVNLNSDEILKRALMSVSKCIVRFYAVSGYDMSSRDNGSASDTYLKLSCNGKVYSERDHYQLDEPNPDFYKSYDFEAYMPGSSPLTIQVWDYDMIFGDEVVGTTKVDLEDRYFSLEWNSLEIKPIEYRQLYHPSSSMSQGVVKCWLEIVPCDIPPEEAPKQWEIAPKPPAHLEVRVVIGSCVEVPMVDAEGCTDAYLRGFFDTKEDVQETDTHFRNSDGKPDFQYRLVYRIEYPRKVTKFTIQLYDADFFSSNDMIGENSVDISNLLEDVSLTKAALCFNKKYYEDVVKKEHEDIKMEFDKKDVSRFWLQMLTKKDGKIEKVGKVQVQIDIMPVSHADKNAVGKARDNPNHSPQLPQPQGRLEFSFNPFKMLGQLVGPALRRKIYCGLCCAACCALFVAILPNLVGGLILKAFP